MKVLVIGGAGYIGSHTVRMLINEGHDTVVYDSLVTGHREFVPESATFVNADIGNLGALRNAMKGIDVVIDFAGFIEVSESEQNPKKYIDNNVIKAYNILVAMKDEHISRIIFSSSAAVYGKPEILPIPEYHPKKPINCYGCTKHIFEQMMKSMGLNYVSLRYFNAAGAGWNLGEAHSPESHLIPLVLRAMKKDGKIRIFGTDYDTPDRTCIRDYIHVKDLARAHLLAMEYLIRNKPSIELNVGCGRGYSVLEVIEACKRATRKIPKVIECKRRDGDPPELVASSEKIRHELSWVPEFSLREMIESAWKWENQKTGVLGSSLHRS